MPWLDFAVPSGAVPKFLMCTVETLFLLNTCSNEAEAEPSKAGTNAEFAASAVLARKSTVNKKSCCALPV